MHTCCAESHTEMEGRKARMEQWDDMRFFLAIARERSLSAAARALHVDHATVGRRLTSLERRLSAKLFNRTPEGNIDVRRFGGTLYHRTAFCGASTGQQLLYTLDEQDSWKDKSCWAKANLSPKSRDKTPRGSKILSCHEIPKARPGVPTLSGSRHQSSCFKSFRK